MEVNILKGEDWQGIYLDGYLYQEDHELGGGQIFYLLNLSEKFGFRYSDISVNEINDEGEEYLSKYGRLPIDLRSFTGLYEV